MGIKINNLSNNIVSILDILSNNERLCQLLLHNESNPFFEPNPTAMKNIANPKSDSCRITPYAFDPEATIEDSSFIRVYYNNGEFDGSEAIQELTLHIDIIVAKNLWLINNDTRSMIRPYEIMDSIVDSIGRSSWNNKINVNFDSWTYLAVNTAFDAIRLYSNYFTVE